MGSLHLKENPFTAGIQETLTEKSLQGSYKLAIRFIALTGVLMEKVIWSTHRAFQGTHS